MTALSNDYQLRTFLIEGLNLGKKIFNWKNRLFISHTKTNNENIASVSVVINRPYKYTLGRIDVPPEDIRDQTEALEIIGSFLACYYLANNKHRPRLIRSHRLITPFGKTESPLKLVTKSILLKSDIKSQRAKPPTDKIIVSLKLTRKLFDKIMKIPKKNNPELAVALGVYQRSREQYADTLKNFLDLVTVLDCLLTDRRGDTTYKFALRTSIFAEKDRRKRFSLFRELQTIYDARSDLVHGHKLPLAYGTAYDGYEEFLRPVVETTLRNYIQLASKGIKKKDILQLIDKKA